MELIGCNQNQLEPEIIGHLGDDINTEIVHGGPQITQFGRAKPRAKPVLSRRPPIDLKKESTADQRQTKEYIAYAKKWKSVWGFFNPRGPILVKNGRNMGTYGLKTLIKGILEGIAPF